MNDAELGAMLMDDAAGMQVEDRIALVESIFDAFRERGESSEDVAEAASLSLERLRAGDFNELRGLIAYAQRSPGLVKKVIAHA